jgi:hypothetical protein
VRKLHVCFQSSNADSKFFVTILRAMRGLEWLELEQNTGEPLIYWARVDDQAGICPVLTTLIITDADTERAKLCVQWLEGVRKRVDLPVARVEIVSPVPG